MDGPIGHRTGIYPGLLWTLPLHSIFFSRPHHIGTLLRCSELQIQEGTVNRGNTGFLEWKILYAGTRTPDLWNTKPLLSPLLHGVSSYYVAYILQKWRKDSITTIFPFSLIFISIICQEVGFLVKLEEKIAKCKLLGHDQLLHVQ